MALCHHRSFRQQYEYTRLKVTHARIPSKLPSAVCDANCGPCSRLMKNKMGPELNGIPKSHPETPGPHLRPARLINAIKTGARKILKRSTGNFTGGRRLTGGAIKSSNTWTSPLLREQSPEALCEALYVSVEFLQAGCLKIDVTTFEI